VNFENYITKILRGTFLSKREKQLWMEEMIGHLEDSLESRIKNGMTHDEAYISVTKSFGSINDVRTKIIHETYGISPRWFVTASVMSFICFVLTLFVNMRVSDVIPSTLTPIPTPHWVSFLDYHFPMSPSAWAGLTVLFLMLVFTRKRKDRFAVFVSLLPLFIVWLVDRMPYHLFSIQELFFTTDVSMMIQPFGIPELTGYVLLFVLSLALYVWTRNRIVSLTLWVISISLTVWPILRDTVQTALWHFTNNPIFWGTSFLDPYYLWRSILTVLIRFIILWLYLYSCKKIDSIGLRKSNVPQ
jgi:branched-subunit amino acid transport protein AzlD